MKKTHIWIPLSPLDDITIQFVNSSQDKAVPDGSFSNTRS